MRNAEELEELKEKLRKATRAMTWALKSEAAPRINAMLDMARSEPSIPILPDQMDHDPSLLNCPNGTLEVRTGMLREHRRGDYLTKLCPTPYHKEATCPVFMKFLKTIFGGNAELIVFTQRVFGRCLSGDVSEQILPILWGVGANGKSTLVNAMMEVMGQDYAMKANADLLMVSRSERHPTEIAQLFGKRLVIASESAEGRRLNESLIKDLTGGERMRGRRMHEDFWEFDPTHKVFLITNYKPEVRGTDDGVWRRIRLIPFTQRFWDPNEPSCPDSVPPEAIADKTLPDKLRQEYPGILAWLLRGCLDWQRDGLTLPEAVQIATAEYRSSQDIIAHWLDEHCLIGPDYSCRAAALFTHYCDWCSATNERPMSQRVFGEALTKRGFGQRLSDGVWRTGLTLRGA